jgi:hypothetical protein
LSNKQTNKKRRWHFSKISFSHKFTTSLEFTTSLPKKEFSLPCTNPHSLSLRWGACLPLGSRGGNCVPSGKKTKPQLKKKKSRAFSSIFHFLAQIHTSHPKPPPMAAKFPLLGSTSATSAMWRQVRSFARTANRTPIDSPRGAA